MSLSVHTFDKKKLSDYLENHIPEFQGPIQSTKFKTGQSNPTFLIKTNNKKFVLRKKPPGKLLPSAHAVDREFKVLKALHATNVPVPQVFHLCEDDTVVGSMFYIMEYIEGRIFWDPTLPEVDHTNRGKIYEATNEVLAYLHQVNVEKVGLLDFGKPGSYFERQVSRWVRQYRSAETEVYTDVEDLIIWLDENTPKDDGVISLVHGDYRLYNIIFDYETPEILAVLDWELSTLGHPYADLAYQCLQWYLPKMGITPGLDEIDIHKLGIPSEQEYIKSYCEKMGIDGIPNWSFYLAFGFFRIAGIAQGVYKRSLQGNASAENAMELGAAVPILGKLGMEIIQGK